MLESKQNTIRPLRVSLKNLFTNRLIGFFCFKKIMFHALFLYLFQLCLTKFGDQDIIDFLCALYDPLRIGLSLVTAVCTIIVFYIYYSSVPPDDDDD
jgi:hypothetical protein